MASETVTIPKAKLEDLEARVDQMRETAKECLQKIEQLIQIAKGEEP